MKLSKTNITITILALILVVMLPASYYWGHSLMELMSEGEFHSILFWIMFIATGIATFFSFLSRYDVALLAAVIGMASHLFAFVLLLSSASGDFGYFLRVYFEFPSLLCMISSGAICILTAFAKKKSK